MYPFSRPTAVKGKSTQASSAIICSLRVRSRKFKLDTGDYSYGAPWSSGCVVAPCNHLDIQGSDQTELSYLDPDIRSGQDNPEEMK